VADDDGFSGPVAGELRLLDPSTRADPAQSRELLHPDFTEFGASGRIWDRESVVAAMAEDPGEPMMAEEMRGFRLAPDVVLLTYRINRPAGSSLRSSIWVQHDRRWVLVFHQGTAVAL
jgi:ribonuclease HI